MRVSGKPHPAWIILAGCCVFEIVMMGLVFNTAGLYFPYFSDEFSISRAEASSLMAFFNVASALSLPITGNILLKKVNLRLLLTFFSALVGVGLILCSTFHGMIPYYLVYTLIGFSVGPLFGITVPTVLGNWFTQKMGLAMGIAMCLAGASGALFNPILSAIILSFGWRTSFVFSGIFALVTLLPVSLFVVKLAPRDGQLPYGASQDVDDKVERTQSSAVSEAEGVPVRKAVKTLPFALFVIAELILGLMVGSQQHLPSHVLSVGFDLTSAASVMSGVLVGLAVGNVALGALLDTIKPVFAIALACTLGIIGCIGLAFSSVLPILIAAGFLFGLSQSVMQTGFPVVVRLRFGERDFGAIFGYISFMGSIGAALASFVGGAIFDATDSYHLLVIGLALANLITILLVAFSFASKTRSTSSANSD